MSKLKINEQFTNMVEVWYTDDEKIGTFQTLECEVHGGTWCFTDKSGADNCIECVKEMIDEKKVKS
jgi:hypothetical protein